MSDLLECSAIRSASPVVLAKVLDEGCNLAIWQRPPLADAATLLNGVTNDVRFTADLDEITRTLDGELTASGFAASPVLDQFRDDVLTLCRLYGSILQTNRMTLRIEIVTTNSCRKWHADYVTARLITTYAGSGTQWIDQADAERVQSGLEPRAVHSLTAGDVGVFQGKLGSDSPAIHRSPPIAGTGEKRLLLVLNPPEES